MYIKFPSPFCYSKQSIKIGDPFQHPGAVFQHIRRDNFWMSTELDLPNLDKNLDAENDAYCLVTCVTVPSFTWGCFNPIKKAEFEKRFPTVRQFPEEHFIPEGHENGDN